MFSNNQSLVFKPHEETVEHSYEELKANFINMRRRQATEKSRLLEVRHHSRRRPYKTKLKNSAK